MGTPGTTNEPDPQDPVLQPFLSATDPAEADRRLEELLSGGIDRAIRQVIRRTLGSGPAVMRLSGAEDEEDVRSEVIVRLLRKLRSFKTGAPPEPIRDFAAYAAGATYHTCYAYLRRRYPEWMRLRNKVRYLVTHDPGLACERSGDAWICRVPASRNHHGGQAGAERPCGRQELSAAAQELAHRVPLSRSPLRDVIRELLDRASGPAELDDLVSAIAELLGVADHRGQNEGKSADAVAALDAVADCRTSAPAARDASTYVRRLWDEIRQLPNRQRIALLLNLRDADGESAVPLLPITGTASIRQIAEALGMTPEDLAGLWRDLPLEDSRIADVLGLSRQQVINLRKAGRARLARRMAACALT